MKIKEGFIIKKILDDILVFPVGENTIDCRYVLKLNETSEFLWNELRTWSSYKNILNKKLKYTAELETIFSEIIQFE